MPPSMLISALESVRRRVKTLSVTYGAGVAVIVAVAALLFTVFADYLLNLPAWPRVIVLLCGIAAVAYVLGRYVIMPAMSRLSLSDVAGRLEQAFPQFNDRLRSTVD